VEVFDPASTRVNDSTNRTVIFLHLHSTTRKSIFLDLGGGMNISTLLVQHIQNQEMLWHISYTLYKADSKQNSSDYQLHTLT
jgi:hypothetical protein